MTTHKYGHYRSKLNTIKCSDEFERICGKRKQKKE